MGTIGVSAGCGDTAVDSEAAQANEPSLSVGSTCEDWSLADAADQRSLAETRSDPVDFIETVNTACTPARKALKIGEAVRTATARPPDPYADTRVAAAFRREIAEEILKSWNRCGSNDVCIPGERASNVNCDQADPQVMVLGCFVVTQKGKQGESDYGYSVKTTVTKAGAYSWRLDRG